VLKFVVQVIIGCNIVRIFYRVTIPEAAYVQFASLTSWWWADCPRNM